MFHWLRKLRENYAFLRRAVDAEGRRIEGLSYAELRELGDGPAEERVVEGRRVLFHAEVFDLRENGDMSVCVEVAGLPTLFGVKPCWHFHKRPDGSVYY